MSINFIKKELTLSQPIEVVWEAVTNPAEIKQWFGSDAVFTLEVGNEGYFEWQNECEGRFAMKIVEIKAPKYFAWRWMFEADVPYSDKGSTQVEWHLYKTVSGGTHLLLLESGFDQQAHRKMNIEGWNSELADFKQFIQDK